MKRIVTILLWLVSLNIVAQQPTATLKIGTIYNPQLGEVLVPITCEAIDNPILGNNLISALGWFIAYDTTVLFAGEPETPATLLNCNPEFPPGEFLTQIIANNPILGWNTIAIYYASGCPGEVYPGAKFFDIQFTYAEGLTVEPNIIWTFSPQGFETVMADDEGNEFLLTLEDGYVGPESNDITFHVTGNGNDIDGAWVTVGPLTLPTNTSGIAVFSLENGDYDYTVTKDGFADAEGTFTVAGEPVQVEVEMEECWDVTFNVIPEDSTIIIINGDTLVPGETICLPDGDYWVIVINPGYYPFEGLITVVSAPVNIEIVLDPILFGVTFFVNCCGESLANIPVTYGTVTVITNAAGMAALQFTEGSYSIDIGGYIFTFTVPDTLFVNANICSEVLFSVSSGGEPVEEASITINNESIVTNVLGIAEYCTTPGLCTYSIEKEGYLPKSGSVTVTTEPAMIEEHLECEVTFYVTWISGPVNNALIECNDTSVYTNGNGLGIIHLENGTYPWTLTHPELNTQGYITVSGEPLLYYIIFEFGLNDLRLQKELITLYPNPSSGKFYLETSNSTSEPIELYVMDLTGRIIYERNPIITERFEIDLSNQQKGLYFLRIKSEEEHYTLKLIIQ